MIVKSSPSASTENVSPHDKCNLANYDYSSSRPSLPSPSPTDRPSDHLVSVNVRRTLVTFNVAAITPVDSPFHSSTPCITSPRGAKRTTDHHSASGRAHRIGCGCRRNAILCSCLTCLTRSESSVDPIEWTSPRVRVELNAINNIITQMAERGNFIRM